MRTSLCLKQNPLTPPRCSSDSIKTRINYGFIPNFRSFILKESGNVRLPIKSRKSQLRPELLKVTHWTLYREAPPEAARTIIGAFTPRLTRDWSLINGFLQSYWWNTSLQELLLMFGSFFSWTKKFEQKQKQIFKTWTSEQICVTNETKIKPQI